ncbi:cation transporter [Azospirillum sp. SYSU D00513]|uniref:cation transporter n=1 Tax=Azospirillum sp. SYSU D00513 TaxID=2812561 RepID=UPI0020002409|nr:cation transporter [Azospirillum sp. SYSU D00513]
MSRLGAAMDQDQDEQGSDSGKGKRLLIALALNVGITVAQIVGGLLSGSLSVLADAAHNASDATSCNRSGSHAAWSEGMGGYQATQRFGVPGTFASMSPACPAPSQRRWPS